MHADVCGDTRKDDVADAALPQHHVEVRRVERALAGLVDDRLALHRRQLVDDLPPRLSPDQNAALRAWSADGCADLLGAPAFIGREVGKVGAVALARVHHVVPERAARRQHLLDRLWVQRTRQPARDSTTWEVGRCGTHRSGHA